jgi:hypothetical protein
MPDITLDPADAAELAETLTFLTTRPSSRHLRAEAIGSRDGRCGIWNS